MQVLFFKSFDTTWDWIIMFAHLKEWITDTQPFGSFSSFSFIYIYCKNGYCQGSLPDWTQPHVGVICRVNVIALACINTTCFLCFLLEISLEGGLRFFLQRDHVKLLQTV